MTNETHIGDGVYACLDPAHMIVLRTRHSIPQGYNEHCIALEPEVLYQLVIFACEIGWRPVITKALHRAPKDAEVAQR